jgi:hypothetical protein
MSQMIETMNRQLAPPDEDCRRRRVYSTSIDRLSDFLRTFDARNVAGDDELQSLVVRATAILDGVTFETVKTDEAVRSNLAAGFQQISEALSPLVETAVRRKFQVDGLPKSPASPAA